MILDTLPFPCFCRRYASKCLGLKVASQAAEIPRGLRGSGLTIALYVPNRKSTPAASAAFSFLEGAFCMNPISNAWKHPKTSVAGMLIAVVTVAGVLSQQGLTLGTAGSGTIVAFVSAIDTA